MLPQFLNDFINQFSQVFLVTLLICYIITFISVLFLLKNESFKIKFFNFLANIFFISGYLYLNKKNIHFLSASLYLSSSIFFFFLTTKLFLVLHYIIQKIIHFFSKSKKKKINLKATRLTKEKSSIHSPQRRSSPFGTPQVMTSFGLKVRSKSEVFIAEKLFEKKIEFKYEIPLSAGGKTYYPDFTLYVGNNEIYWEHFGMMSDETYAEKTEIKIKWYKKNFPNKLIWTEESSQLMPQIHDIVEKIAKSKRHPQIHQILKQMHDSKGHASQHRRI